MIVAMMRSSAVGIDKMFGVHAQEMNAAETSIVI